MIALTPKPPYYAVLFTSVRKTNTVEENYAYQQMATFMNDLAKKQPGYLGVESAREDIGITISYWQSLDAITNWKKNSEHIVAQQMGIKKWYKAYKTRICLVERDYEFEF